MASGLNLDYGSTGAEKILDELARMKAELEGIKAKQDLLTRSQGPKSWFDQFVRGVGIFNTLNKGFDFLMKRIRQIGDLMTNWIGLTLDVGGAFEGATKQLEALLGRYEQFDPGITAQVVDMTRELGMSTEHTAEAASKAAASFIQLGFEGEDALKGIPQILDLATARSLSLEEATDIAAVTSRQFGRDMDDLGETLDILNALHVTSGASIKSSSAAMKQMGVVARAAGLEFSESAAAIGILGDAGIRFGKAGTDMRNILSRITGQTSTAMGALEQLGVSVRDSSGEFRETMEILNEVRERYEGLTGAEKNFYSAKIAGTRAMASFNVLMDAGGRSIEEYSQQLEAATGITKEHAGVIRSTYQNSVAILRSGVEALAESLFGFIGGPATDFNNQLSRVYQEAARGFHDLNEKIQAEGFTVDVLAEGFEDIINRIAPEVGKVFDLVKDIADKTVTAISAAAPAITGAIQEAITPAMDWLRASVGEWIDSIFGQEFTDRLTELFATAFSAAIQGALAAIEGGVRGIYEAIPENIRNLLFGEKGAQRIDVVLGGETAKEKAAGKEEIEILQQHFSEMQEKAFQETIKTGGGDQERLERIRKEMELTRQELEKLGITVERTAWEEPGAPQPLSPEEKARQQEETQALDQALSEMQEKWNAQIEEQRRQQEAMAKAGKVAEARGVSIEEAMGIVATEEAEAAATEEQRQARMFQIEGLVEANKETMAWQQSLMDVEKATRDVEQAMFDLATIDLQAELSLVDIREDFDAYMLEPINEFEQRAADVFGKFTDMWADFGKSAVDVKEKFQDVLPDVTDSSMKKELAAIAEKQEEVLKKRLEMTQTAEGRAQIAGELAALMEERAEAAETPEEQRKYAQEALDYYGQAQEESVTAQEKELQLLEQQQQRDQERRGLLEEIVATEGPAAAKIPAFEQLREIAKRGGETEALAEAQAGLEEAILQDAEEQAARAEQQLEYLKLIAENTKLMSEKLGLEQRRQQGEEGRQGQRAYNPEAGFYGTPESGYTKPPTPFEDWRFYKGYHTTEEGKKVFEFGNQ
jgi:TP901 family phage tail tape measure protein